MTLIDGVVIRSRADLARHLGVSRAYVTQVLGPVVRAVHAPDEDAPDGRDVTVQGAATAIASSPG